MTLCFMCAFGEEETLGTKLDSPLPKRQRLDGSSVSPWLNEVRSKIWGRKSLKVQLAKAHYA